MISRLQSWRDGNVALTFALLAPLLLALVGAGVDYGRYGLVRAEIQEIADAAAIGGARQYLLSRDNAQLPEAVARNAAASGLRAGGYFEAAALDIGAAPADASVTVGIDYSLKPTFLVGMFKNPIEIAVAATAQARGGANICVIGLNPSANGAVMLNTNAKITGTRCAVYSNSTDSGGLAAYRTAKITSSFTCTAGGYMGPDSNFSPAPITDCPARDNPLANRIEPTVGACTYTRKQVDDYVGSLQPGVYCGGLTINGASDVTFEPGIYIIKDGPMQALRTSKIAGENVGFYFTGRNADVYLQDNVEVNLSGPVAGPMAGVLFWQTASGNTGRMFEIRSNKVHTLVGAIYLPQGKFYAAVDAPVAQSSAYTAIIADRIELDGNVELVLNTNYADTDVPPPPGLAGAGKQVTLRR